jgi:hypothetical protein
MSTALVESRSARLILGLGFTMLAIIDTVLVMLAFQGVLQGVLGDIGWGQRLILGLFGLALSWLICRQTYMLLVRGETPVMAALDTSMILAITLLLSVLAFAFLGPGTWMFFAVVLLVLFLWAAAVLWRLAGPLAAILMVLGAVAAAVLVWILH